MPNWASGIVRVKGKKKNVKSFLNLFIFDDKAGKEEKDKYFARSFTLYDKNIFFKEFEEEHKNKKDDDLIKHNINIDFAWSCYSCCIKGYPQKDDEYITLEEATEKYNVWCEIETEERGNSFAEHIIYDKGIEILNECRDLNHFCYKCDKELTDEEEERCKKLIEHTINETEDDFLDTAEGYLCDDCYYTHPLQKIINNKIKQIKNEK